MPHWKSQDMYEHVISHKKKITMCKFPMEMFVESLTYFYKSQLHPSDWNEFYYFARGQISWEWKMNEAYDGKKSHLIHFFLIFFVKRYFYYITELRYILMYPKKNVFKKYDKKEWINWQIRCDTALWMQASMRTVSDQFVNPNKISVYYLKNESR